MDGRVLDIIIKSFPKILIPGLTMTIPLSVVSFAIGLVLALLTALARITNTKVLKQISSFYVWFFRGTPLLVQIFIIFYGLPSIGVLINPVPAAIIAFSLNVGAYASECMRAAIESIPKGQMEAGLCAGMSYWQIMRRIILPQAMRVAFPTLGNTFIGLLKDTSLAANITVTDMFLVTERLVAKTYEPMVLYCEVAIIYLAFCTILTQVQKWGEKKLTVHHKEVA